MPSPFDAYRGHRNWTPDRPRDPRCAHLGVIDIEIEHAAGILKTDPNGIVLKVITGFEELLPLVDTPSILSGKPAVLYRTSEIEVALTVDELERLTLRCLTPEEFFKLCDTVGAIWEVHDDFYDPDTGEALQPKNDFSPRGGKP